MQPEPGTQTSRSTSDPVLATGLLGLPCDQEGHVIRTNMIGNSIGFGVTTTVFQGSMGIHDSCFIHHIPFAFRLRI